MKPEILVIYYSQSGQLRQILDKVVEGLQSTCVITFVKIEPASPFPFPWTKPVFFDCMPETVQQIPEPIQPLSIEDKNYDLVILGYQPWFLSPSIPFNSFLFSPYANVLKDKKVLTVIGSRNMWLNAQEKTKERLITLGAQLVGNIVFFDRHPNLVSMLTINRWSFTGRKEATTFMPEAGVQQKDILEASRFGSAIIQAIQQKDTTGLQKNLLSIGAVTLNPALIVLEKRGITKFRKLAVYIREKGERGDPARLPRVRMFQRMLDIGIFILSPLSSIAARLIILFNKKRFETEVDYFKNTGYRKNAI